MKMAVIPVTGSNSFNRASMMDNQVEQLSMRLNSFKQQYADFIEIAAHDLQAPLRKLSVLTERLTAKYRDVDRDDIQQYISRIDGCLRDMRSLINSMSEIAGAAPDTMRYASCHLGVMFKQILNDLDPLIKEKKAELIVAALPVIECDMTQCRQLFKNLLDNALRFSKENVPPGIEVKSTVLSVAEKEQFNLQQDGTYHKIEIADNGIGFDSEYAAKIFQPFVRLNGKAAFEGNGLGLALCKKIVDNHRGILFADGAENEGARFIVILPETHS
jgi:light-regulated signal transduction histidine kinase (bacteriophytochrome)